MVNMVFAKLSGLKNGEITASDNIKDYLDFIKKKDNKINAFIAVNKNAAEDAKEVDKKLKSGKAGKLAGLAIAVKSNISVKGLPVTCASKALEDYKGTFDADVISKIRAEDGIIMGMVNMDEFACGISGETSYFGATQNPAAPGRVPGGSSSGSAAAVAADMCDLAIGSDTGGSIRNPASHCGIIGIKPSYGRVSRYGLVDMAMSLEGIGTLGRDVYGNALLMEVISGKSKFDAVTADNKVGKYTTELGKKKKLTIGMSEDFEKLCTDRRIYKAVESKAGKLAEVLGGKVRNVKMQHVDLAIQTYYPIVYVEFFSSTRKFDGRKYGRKIEDNCGEEVLRRILGGREISKAEYKGKYYRKALIARKIITKSFAEAFKGVDLIALPTTPMLPHRMGEVTDPRAAYAYDAFTVTANLAGICGGVFPAGKVEDAPVGLQLLAPCFCESNLLNAMHKLEQDL
ncbi:Asp-tRNA(Asn)/Glu-tRNA(Gln) amidotransferase subunit GatA [Candidatus Woesearchaeota archaeon]|nr:Asp-tRNA(Asn)/Glu-tRNA(Gln) amidotransferase subunit GatA [Candidatus Woesearchaeota archaeon]